MFYNKGKHKPLYICLLTIEEFYSIFEEVNIFDTKFGFQNVFVRLVR